jgi:arylsulfatase A-like enzyme
MALCHDVTDDLKGEFVAYYRDGRWMTYAEMISSMDDMVGRLVAALDQMGVRDNTLILFTTDNGTPAASYLTVNDQGKMVRPKVVSARNGHVVPGGKGKFDDTGTRVPLIANWPGRIKPGQEVDDMVDLTDYLPTLSEVAGLEDDGVPRDGISFAPVLLGQPDRARKRPWVFFELRGTRCVRSPRWKLYDDGRFFDLKNDPGEKDSLDQGRRDGEAERNFAELSRVLGGLKGPI